MSAAHYAADIALTRAAQEVDEPQPTVTTRQYALCVSAQESVRIDGRSVGFVVGVLERAGTVDELHAEGRWSAYVCRRYGSDEVGRGLSYTDAIAAVVAGRR